MPTPTGKPFAARPPDILDSPPESLSPASSKTAYSSPTMRGFLRIIATILIFAGSAALAAFLVYKFYIFPQLTPMLDHDLAWNYSQVLSQTTAADLAAVSIRIPDQPTVLTQIDARQLLQRLHDTGRFPEWKPSFRLVDSRGKPLEFTILPTPPTANVHPKQLKGDYTFTVKPSTLRDPVQYP